jgi:hypothetical protein
LDIDDSHITETGICGAPRNSSNDPPTTLSAAIHVFRLRCIWARVHAALYSDVSTLDHDTYNMRTEQLHTELENWIASVPPIPHRVSVALSVFPSRDWYELTYSESIILLYRGQLTDGKGAPDNVFMECVQAAENICQGCRRQYIGKPVNYTWGTLHTLFMGGLTYLHCLWTSSAVREAVRYDAVGSMFTTCTMLLAVMAERWEDAGPYRDIFEALASRAMTMVVDKNHKEWMIPTPSTSWDSLDPGDLTQWMAEITDMGMSDGVDRLLWGLVGDFTSQDQGSSNPGRSLGENLDSQFM